MHDPATWTGRSSGRVSAVTQNPEIDGPLDLSSILDIGDVPAVEVVLTVSMHLMTAAAIACGLGDDDREPDLAEARILITALAGLVTAAAPSLGSMHAAPLRDGLKSLQLAFREASVIPDPPGMAPGEGFTGPVL